MINQGKLNIVISRFGEDFQVVNEHTGEVCYKCPFCKDRRKKGRKLYVNVNRLLYYCFRCGEKGYMGNDPGADLAGGSRLSLKELFSESEEEECLYRIPSLLLADCRDSRGYQYMLSRGFNENDMREYSMRLAGLNDGDLLGRVVIPNRIISLNYTDIYTARSFVGHPNKYKNALGAKKNKILFNFHRIPEKPEYLILNEGPLNSIIAGNLSVASYGKILSDEQFQMIAGLNPKHLYISYDMDAEEIMDSLCAKFQERTSITPHKVILPDGQDAVDLGREKYLDIVFNSPAYGNREERIFSFLQKFMEDSRELRKIS